MLFKQFYLKNAIQKKEIIDQYLGSSVTYPQLPEQLADNMIENYLFNYQIPLGILPQIRVNDRDYVVPMVTEEPSVIAAAANGAKRLGNIQSHMAVKHLIGQMIFYDLSPAVAQQALAIHYDQWMSVARAASSSMVKRGGGPVKIFHKGFSSALQDYQTFYLEFDACEAMGANVLNTVLEQLADLIAEATGGKLLMAILSNHAPHSLVEVTASLPIQSLAEDASQAKDLAQRIVFASDYAQQDPYRASTHNKGIMNGIDAVLLATGNDWRAVEAGVHSFASNGLGYRSLSRWELDATKTILIGQLSLPLPVATIGGTLSIHPIAQWSLQLMKHPTAKELAELIGAVGLAQNFAALRALVSEGIQQGHMGLQARALAIQVGAKEDEIDKLVQQLKTEKAFDSIKARDLLDKMRHS